MTTQDWIIIAAGWIALAMVQAGVMWDNHCHGRRLDRHRADLNNHARRLTLGEHRPAATSIGQPMPTVTKVTATVSGDEPLQRHKPYNGPEVRPVQGGWVNAQPWGRENGPELTVTQVGLRSLRANESRPATACTTDTDATLRLARPPALSDVAAAILGAGRPLTRATLDVQLDRDTRTEVRDGLLAGTLQMVRTHDDEPAYWPTGHPVPGDTVRMAKMPVLPGLVRP